MKKIKLIILILAILFIEIIILSTLYNKWFDTVDMIKYDDSFSPEDYFNRTSKMRENLIYYSTIVFFLFADIIYIKKVFKKESIKKPYAH